MQEGVIAADQSFRPESRKLPPFFPDFALLDGSEYGSKFGGAGAHFFPLKKAIFEGRGGEKFTSQNKEEALEDKPGSRTRKTEQNWPPN